MKSFLLVLLYLLFSTSGLQATIIYHSFGDLVLADNTRDVNTDAALFSYDLDGNGLADLLFTNNYTARERRISITDANSNDNRDVIVAMEPRSHIGYITRRFDSGQTFDGLFQPASNPQLILYEIENYPDGGFSNFYGTRAYLGFFTMQGLNYRYGWIELSISGTANGSEIATRTLTLHGIAYETTPGVMIVAGQVPEPSSAILLLGLLGAGTLGRYRQKPVRI